MKRVNLIYPVSAREPQGAVGLIDNHHLNGLNESVDVNVGGLHGEMSSPSMKRVSVGGSIVVGARESRVQGEGGQGTNRARRLFT
jgi:hypothetical protein